MTVNGPSLIKALLGKLRVYVDRFLGSGILKDFMSDLHNQQVARLEAVRIEILLEMRYGRANKELIETRIVNAGKFERLVKENELVLNIGSGCNCIEGMVNLDMRELPGIDVVADAAHIQLPKAVAKGVFSAHVLEHFSHEKLRRSVLPNWVSLLGEGGQFRAVVPDAEGMMQACRRGDMSFEDFRTVTFGLQEYEGDTHYTMFSRDSLKALLEEAGLADVTYIATSRANGLCLEMEVLAYKPPHCDAVRHTSRIGEICQL